MRGQWEIVSTTNYSIALSLNIYPCKCSVARLTFSLMLKELLLTNSETEIKFIEYLQLN